MDDFGSAALKRLIDEMADAVIDTHAHLGDATARVEPGRIADVLRFCRDDLGFEMLMDLTAVDYLPEQPRFEIVYHLYSLENNERVRVKARVSEPDPRIASVSDLYNSANWMEREVFDMYGVDFDGHPDMRRILLYDEFEGYPLRKDYPKEKRQPLVGPRN